MSLISRSGGHYDEEGNWQRLKFCFVSCGSRCTCRPPGGIYYSAAHDMRKKSVEEATTGPKAEVNTPEEKETGNDSNKRHRR